MASTPAPSTSTEAVKETWAPTTAGVLCIVAGVADSLSSYYQYYRPGGRHNKWNVRTGCSRRTTDNPWYHSYYRGTFALRRRVWGLALAGAICAMM